MSAVVAGAIGAGVSALAPLVSGIYSEYKQGKRNKVTRRDIEKAIRENDALSEQQKRAITEYFDNNRVTSTEDIGRYVQSLKDTNYMTAFDEYEQGLNEEFNYDKTKEDFYNENADKIIGDTIAKSQGLASAQGMGRSFDGLQSMTKDAIDKNAELMRDASKEYGEDYDRKYREFTDYLQTARNKYLDRTTAMQSDLALQGELAQFAHDYNQSEFEHLMNADTSRINNRLMLQGVKASV